jgi:2-polyprenyl-3-methyl-5-hydroxy-6-metoxy-1,4-benzoquinol methylase
MMEEKFILDMTDEEILDEISLILKHKVVKQTEQLGWLTDDLEEYVIDNKVDSKKLYELYRSSKKLDAYITTLSIMSLRNRPKDLFKLIRDQTKGKKVLEYGCGTSTHGIACAQLGCEVHICDISQRMMDIANSRYRLRRLDVKQHTISDHFPDTLPNNYFDVIICADVVEHIPDPITLLKHFISWLKVGGIIHLHVSFKVNLYKGHLSQAIRAWKSKGQSILKKKFEKISDHNYKLIK